jgi:hypothetical protein
MTTKNLFTFAGVIALIFGLPLIFNPDFVNKTFLVDSTMSAGTAFSFRGYGILLSSVGIGLLSARNSAPSTGNRGLLLIIVTGATVGLINSIYMAVTGLTTNSNWLIVILLAIEAIWGITIFAKGKTV